MHRLVAVLSSILLLAGCAGADLAKQRFPRTTIPADAENASDPTGSSQKSPPATDGKPVDPAFAPDKLRLTDPCELLDEDVLKRFGTPGDRSRSGFSRCSNFMKDKGGKDLAVTVEVGQTMTTELKNADKQLAGLRSYEQVLDNSACFVSVITQEQPGLGITVQIGYEDGDACAPGREMAVSVVEQIKARAATRTPAKGSLITLDPCVLPDKAAVEAAAGADYRLYPYGLHNCAWVGKDREVSLAFRETFIPDDREFDAKQTEVDLGGGVTGYQVSSSTAFPSCEVKWVQLAGSDNDGEIGEVKSAGPKATEFDRCATAVAFAKAVIGKIPKG
ncbi:DUF3558 domain-containing protein [Saccharothrix sp. S26]|uniref:DUF3558 domain-containing protein n=1 Tax=Saccharothrix sp. S26 TaxID=2907215 RepID=UPI001F1CED44|nr:DUF3558 domain-containing protein [Saccharothrix sp. S26]MCE6997877.1 DUF3558 domain-containing protein [Saccharothrix sp. S26]